MKDDKVLKRFLGDTKRIMWGLVFCAFISIAIITLNIISPYILSDIINNINAYFKAKINAEPLPDLNTLNHNLIVVLSCLYIVLPFLYWLKMYSLNNIVSKHFTCTLRIEMGDKLSRLPVSFLDKTLPGEFLHRMTDDVSNMGNTVHSVLDTLFVGLIQVIAIVVMMFMVSWPLAIIVLVLVPISIIISSKLSDRSSVYWDGVFKSGGELSSFVEESYNGLDSIKSFGIEQKEITRFEEYNKKNMDNQYKAFYYSQTVTPVIVLCNNFSYLLICLIGGILAITGKASLGSVVAIILYSTMISGPLESIAEGFASMQRVKASAKRVYEILDSKEITKQNDVIPKDIKGDVSFENVCFRYDENKPLIENFNLSIKAGQKVAIVGPTGAGKTTLINLLMRFYDLNSGKITIDGYDISKYNRGSVRELFSMVLQDTWLFNGTVKDNISYGREDATQEEIEKACKSAFCDRFITSLPEGYSTIIDESMSGISGGQKQLLTLARAFLISRHLLILDEATSNVDTRTELLIQEAMDNLMKDKTCFVIAHRLSTIINSDIIIVINNGQIIETGKHQDLMDKKGFYYDMFTSQYKS